MTGGNIMLFDLGFFDLNGDGEVPFDEELIGMAILDDILSEEEKDEFDSDDIF